MLLLASGRAGSVASERLPADDACSAAVASLSVAFSTREPPLACVARLFDVVGGIDAGAVLPSEVARRCLRRKSSVERADELLLLSSNGDGCASSADDALVDCSCRAAGSCLVDCTGTGALSVVSP